MSAIAPVLFIVFNRPDTTARVFEAIRQARPVQLFVAADGPRNEAERSLTEEVRRITEAVDWPCEVYRDYAGKNLGCKWRPYTAITWAFEQVEELIILEDDCLPHGDFFVFCSRLLEWHRDSSRVLHISGNNFQGGNWRGDSSYYFSKYSHNWGWATWKQAWAEFDIQFNFWEFGKDEILDYGCQTKIERDYWNGIFDEVYKKGSSVWDYQWLANLWYNKGLAATPNTNLVENIGFNQSATHTHNTKNGKLNPSTYGLTIEGAFAQEVQDVVADAYTFNNAYYTAPKTSIVSRVLNQIIQTIKAIK